MDTDSCIPANPDISGIGVRTAIYAQNLLCFLPVILYLRDGDISVDELAGIQDQSTGMLAIAFAILITTVSLAAGHNPTVSNYHAAIILDLSWMNNTSTWIWFILYVYERSRATYKHVAPTWTAWRTSLWSAVRTHLLGSGAAGSPTGPKSQSEELDQTRLKHFWNVKWVRRFAQLLMATPVLTLGSLHLSTMAAIGIWLWHDPARFGKPINQCTPMLTLFGASVSINSTPLRIFSLTMYAIILVPGLNLLPPFAFFLFLHISYNYVRTKIHIYLLHRKVEKENSMPVVGEAVRIPRKIGPVNTQVWTAFLYVGLFCLVATNLLFIVDTELTLQRNLHNQSREERDWGFGQILALLLLFVPLRDAWVALRTMQNNVQQRFDQAFHTVAKAKTALSDIEIFLQKGASPRKPITGRFGHFLQLAAYFGRRDLTELIIAQVDVNAIGGDYGTALQAAAARGHKDVVEYLLEFGAQVNFKGGDYWTALCAACANGHVEVVQILLKQNGIAKREKSMFGAPLHVAVILGKRRVVEALLEDGAEAADCSWGDTNMKALDIAYEMFRHGIQKILKRKGLTAGDHFVQERHRLLQLELSPTVAMPGSQPTSDIGIDTRDSLQVYLNFEELDEPAETEEFLTYANLVDDPQEPRYLLREAYNQLKQLVDRDL